MDFLIELINTAAKWIILGGFILFGFCFLWVMFTFKPGEGPFLERMTDEEVEEWRKKQERDKNRLF